MTGLTRLANGVVRAGALGAHMWFRRALNAPAVAQSAILQRILRENAATAYGRTHDFSAIHSTHEYAQRVPLVDYDALVPWIDRIARGEPRALTAEPRLRGRAAPSGAR